MVIFKNAKIILKDQIIESYFLAVEDNKIVDIYQDEKKYTGDTIDVKDNYLSPGFIDIHVHGGGEGDFLDGTEETIHNIIKLHTQHGTTGIYPTTLACDDSELCNSIQLIKKVQASHAIGAEILGMHLEGPYLAKAQKGAQDEKYIKLPCKEEYESIFQFDNLIKRVTFAPELEGAIELADELSKHNIVASMGHSEAEYKQIKEAYDHGVKLVTHLYSGMEGVHRVNGFRRLGMVESAFLLEDMNVEIIADGCHLPVELLKLIFKIKGPDRIALITDAMRAAGRESGNSVLGSLQNGQMVILKDGVAYMPDFQVFAGSIATMDRLVRNMYKKVGVKLHEAIKMASLTPSRIMGCSDRKGSIEKNKDADLVIFDENINIQYVMTKGHTFLNSYQ